MKQLKLEKIKNVKGEMGESHLFFVFNKTIKSKKYLSSEFKIRHS